MCSSLLHDQRHLVNVHNPHIYLEQQQPPLDYFSLLRLKSSHSNTMASFKNWLVLPNDSVNNIQSCTYGMNIAADNLHH